jgi:hypothetical protein
MRGATPIDIPKLYDSRQYPVQVAAFIHSTAFEWRLPMPRRADDPSRRTSLSISIERGACGNFFLFAILLLIHSEIISASSIRDIRPH